MYVRVELLDGRASPLFRGGGWYLVRAVVVGWDEDPTAVEIYTKKDLDIRTYCIIKSFTYLLRGTAARATTGVTK